MPSGTESAEAFCPYCENPIEADIVIRCPLCRTAHHLGCYADHKGCSEFDCLTPETLSPSASQRSEDELVEEVYRAELRSVVTRWNWGNETLIAFSVLVLFATFVSLILLLT